MVRIILSFVCLVFLISRNGVLMNFVSFFGFHESISLVCHVGIMIDILLQL